MKYPNPDSKSAALFEKAQRVLTEGGSRSTIRISPYSIYVREAQGKYVTDIDGNAVPGRDITIVSERLEWRYVDGEWTEVAAATESCEPTSGGAPKNMARTFTAALMSWFSVR